MESPNSALLPWLARSLMIAKGNREDAYNFASARGAPTRVLNTLKAVGATSSGDWNGVDHDIIVGGFSESLRTRSVFFRMLSDGAFVRVGLRTRLGIVIASATAALKPGGSAIALSKLELRNQLLEPLSAASMFVATDEILADISSAGQQLFVKELRAAVSDETDRVFFDAITDSSTPVVTSSGTSATAAKNDLRNALMQTNSLGTPALFWVCAVDVAKAASTLTTDDGADAFPAMSATSGELANLPALVSSVVPYKSMYLIDGSGIAADMSDISVKTSGEANVQMTSPATGNSATPTGALTTSLFQTNSSALRAVVTFGAERLHDNAVTQITGIDWGIEGSA
jgi:hypothetical protein